MATINEVADHILNISEYGLSQRELQKLLYFAQGFYLAQTGEPLFNEHLEAWEHGPVCQTIWHRFKDYGYHALPKPKPEQLAPLSAAALGIITAVVIAFGAVGQQKLIDFSHSDSPWASRYIPNANKLLPNEDLQNYFVNFQTYEDYLAVSQGKQMFSELIKQRIEYLRELPSIGNQWISGSAVAPSEDACAALIDFLNGYEKHLFANHAKPEIPKLILGPIPSGGVGIELLTSTKNLYIHFHNNGQVEIDVEQDGLFTEEETTLEQFKEESGNYFNAFTS